MSDSLIGRAEEELRKAELRLWHAEKEVAKWRMQLLLLQVSYLPEMEKKP